MLLPKGVDDFRKLVENKGPNGEGYLYVDKTLFIKDILYDGSDVTVVTRPRRFGKTLNLSMLHYFFAPEVDGIPTAGLFDGLNISQHENCMRRQGQRPVIFMTLKDVKPKKLESAIYGVYEQIRLIYEENRWLLDSDKISEQEKAKYIAILSEQPSDDELKYSLSQLTRLIYRGTGKKPLILIDEYDATIHAAYEHKYYDDFMDFMRDLFSAALKGNKAMHKAVLTGVVRASKESLFSGLNHVEIYSVLQPLYSNAFGFTEEEVDKLFAKAGLESDKDVIKSWYNGYQLSENLIYNPCSIISCIGNKGKTTFYWVNTSSNDLIKQKIIEATPSVKAKIADLIQGKTTKQLINEHFVFDDLKKSQSALWSLLLMSGYLTTVSSVDTDDGEVCELKIPNKEVENLYKTIIKGWLSGQEDLSWYQEFLADLTEGRFEQFEEKLKIVVEQTLSYNDTSVTNQESFYHGLMLGFVAGLKDRYEIKSNRESGRGRYDVAMFPKKENMAGIIMEFKAKEEGLNFEKAAKLALKQIEETGYDTEMTQRGIMNVFKIGLGFSGKDFKMLWKKVEQ